MPGKSTQVHSTSCERPVESQSRNHATTQRPRLTLRSPAHAKQGMLFLRLSTPAGSLPRRSIFRLCWGVNMGLACLVFSSAHGAKTAPSRLHRPQCDSTTEHGRRDRAKHRLAHSLLPTSDPSLKHSGAASSRPRPGGSDTSHCVDTASCQDPPREELMRLADSRNGPDTRTGLQTARQPADLSVARGERRKASLTSSETPPSGWFVPLGTVHSFKQSPSHVPLG